MGRGTLSAVVAAAAVIVVAAAGCPATTGGSSSSGRPDAGPLCRTAHPSDCDAGTCSTGVCLPNCVASSDCATGQYCEGSAPPRNVCAWNQPIPCTVNSQCPLPQICFSGLCTVRETLADGGYDPCAHVYPDSDCAPEAICLSTTTGQSCIGLPACGQDGTCPTGGYGSVCNDRPDGGRFFPAKQRVCLFGYCDTSTDCPQNAGAGLATQCFRSTRAVPYGECQLGGVGDPCFTGTDCPQAKICLGADGGLDDGGVPGVCRCADGGTIPDGSTACP